MRGQRKFVAGWLTTVLLGLAISIFLFGLNNHLDYLAVLGVLAKAGESYFPNQSVNGLLNRLFDNGSVIVWEENVFPPYNAIVRWGTLVSSATIISTVLLYGRSRKPTLLEFQLAALAFTMASPIAWEHHYGILPLIFISAYFGLQNFSHNNRRKFYYLILSVSYVLAANFLGTIYRIAESPMNIIYSYLFFGSAILALLIYIIIESLNQKTGAWL
jgi:alpha-1,2-mannosyltransferase